MQARPWAPGSSYTGPVSSTLQFSIAIVPLQTPVTAARMALCFRPLLVCAIEQGRYSPVSLNFLVWKMGKKANDLVAPAETGVGWTALVYILRRVGQLMGTHAFFWPPGAPRARTNKQTHTHIFSVKQNVFK